MVCLESGRANRYGALIQSSIHNQSPVNLKERIEQMKYRELSPDEIEAYNIGYKVGNRQIVITDIEWESEEEHKIYRKGYMAGLMDYKRNVSNVSNVSNVDIATPTTPIGISIRNSIENNNTESNKGGMGGKERDKTLTLEEVLEYARQQNEMAGMGGFPVTQEQASDFYHHYEAQGWIAGNGIPIWNWKPKLREWVKERYKPGKAPPRISIKEMKDMENHAKLQKMLNGEL